MSSYEINSSQQYYGLTFEDNISKHFNISNTCGHLVFDDVKNTNNTLDNVGDLVRVFGTDSASGIIVEIFASDYAIISKDENVTLTFNFQNLKANAAFS